MKGEWEWEKTGLRLQGKPPKGYAVKKIFCFLSHAVLPRNTRNKAPVLKQYHTFRILIEN